MPLSLKWIVASRNHNPSGQRRRIAAGRRRRESSLRRRTGGDFRRGACCEFRRIHEPDSRVSMPHQRLPFVPANPADPCLTQLPPVRSAGRAWLSRYSPDFHRSQRLLLMGIYGLILMNLLATETLDGYSGGSLKRNWSLAGAVTAHLRSLGNA